MDSNIFEDQFETKSANTMMENYFVPNGQNNDDDQISLDFSDDGSVDSSFRISREFEEVMACSDLILQNIQLKPNQAIPLPDSIREKSQNQFKKARIFIAKTPNPILQTVQNYQPSQKQTVQTLFQKNTDSSKQQQYETSNQPIKSNQPTNFTQNLSDLRESLQIYEKTQNNSNQWEIFSNDSFVLQNTQFLDNNQHSKGLIHASQLFSNSQKQLNSSISKGQQSQISNLEDWSMDNSVILNNGPIFLISNKQNRQQIHQNKNQSITQLAPFSSTKIHTPVKRPVPANVPFKFDQSDSEIKILDNQKHNVILIQTTKSIQPQILSSVDYCDREAAPFLLKLRQKNSLWRIPQKMTSKQMIDQIQETYQFTKNATQKLTKFSKAINQQKVIALSMQNHLRHVSLQQFWQLKKNEIQTYDLSKFLPKKSWNQRSYTPRNSPETRLSNLSYQLQLFFNKESFSKAEYVQLRKKLYRFESELNEIAEDICTEATLFDLPEYLYRFWSLGQPNSGIQKAKIAEPIILEIDQIFKQNPNLQQLCWMKQLQHLLWQKFTRQHLF